MAWQFKRPVGLILLVLLSGCTMAGQASGPQTLAPSPLSSADIAKLQQHAYKQGYEAGRSYQKKLDAQQAAAPAQQPADSPAADAPAPAPVQPLPPPAVSYSAKGPAKPVATPLN